jgi:DNA-directed RNA polymerase specialized sigma24 family protein
MARTKTWTDADRAAALDWIERKAKTSAVFNGHSGSNATALERLKGIADLTDFAAAVQATLAPAAHRRLLGALRQRKHQAGAPAPATPRGGDESLKARVRTLEAELATARAGCDSAQAELAAASELIVNRDQDIDRLKAEVERLKARLRDKKQEHIEAEATGLMHISGADELVDTDEAVLLALVSVAVRRKATYILEWVHAELLRRAQRAPASQTEEVHGDEQSISLTPPQRAAMLLARAHIEDGQTEEEALKSANITGELTDATIKRLLEQYQGLDIKPVSRPDRDQTIRVMAGAFSNYRIASMLGCSEGTVRNVIKRASKPSD